MASPGPAGSRGPSWPPAPPRSPWPPCAVPAAKAMAPSSSLAALVTPPLCTSDSILNRPPLPLWWERLNYPYRYQPCGQICSSASAERLLTRTLVLPHDWFPPTMGALLKFHSFTHHVAPMRMGTHSRVLGPLSQALPQTRKPGKWLSHEASRWRSTLWCGGSSSVRMLKQTLSHSSGHVFPVQACKPQVSPCSCALSRLHCCQPGVTHR